MYQPEVHEFAWPVKLASDEELKSVEIGLFTLGDQRELTNKFLENKSAKSSKSSKDKAEIALMRACIAKSTGLAVSDLKRLVTPDYTSLQNKVHEFMSQTASYFAQQSAERELIDLYEQLDKLVEAGADQSEVDLINKQIEALEDASGDFDVDAPALLIPIECDDGSTKSSYKLKPPTVAMTDMMDEYDDEWKRTIFISQSCTGFTESELLRLSVPDWNQLQKRLIDFLGEAADYFRRVM